ncbi:hypothetical protein Rhom172_1962 [Rhodothermus marinus SG0.5JP17-172]|uniref:hypothetical protein n=1 Tax=Rhodothermus marinus TaxID=29549 RepID=UPI000223D7ED|nr:hypothetical protein [Rhodothermus marinus]AEN73872.1 hypothetical protein Rhom172_1962 [Rhodothermus marinus SG0.5JP17-172]
MEPVSDYQPEPERRVGPTVSKDKWINHAKNKLARGYVLIVGTERRNANFYLRGKGYEMCPYDVAQAMIKQGLVVQTGKHHLGLIYELVPEAKAELQQRHRPRTPEPEPDTMETILGGLEDEEEAEPEAVVPDEALDEDLDEELDEDEFDDEEEDDEFDEDEFDEEDFEDEDLEDDEEKD